MRTEQEQTQDNVDTGGLSGEGLRSSRPSTNAGVLWVVKGVASAFSSGFGRGSEGVLIPISCLCRLAGRSDASTSSFALFLGLSRDSKLNVGGMNGCSFSYSSTPSHHGAGP